MSSKRYRHGTLAMFLIPSSTLAARMIIAASGFVGVAELTAREKHSPVYGTRARLLNRFQDSRMVTPYKGKYISSFAFNFHSREFYCRNTQHRGENHVLHSSWCAEKGYSGAEILERASWHHAGASWKNNPIIALASDIRWMICLFRSSSHDVLLLVITDQFCCISISICRPRLAYLVNLSTVFAGSSWH